MIPRLGVNIDHVATLRQLRGTPYPSILDAARIAEQAGAQQITVHLREDRRHIQDADVKVLRAGIKSVLNLEMSVSPAIVAVATRIMPDWACLVPEKRTEVTTEGGLDIAKNKRKVMDAVKKLKKAGIRVSCFIEPSVQAVKLSYESGADAVEFHTGRFCMASQGALGARSKAIAKTEIENLKKAAAAAARKFKLHPHAGHGFDYENVRPVAELTDAKGEPLIEEYNIGHSIVCRAAIVGLDRAVREMVSAIAAP